MHAFSVEVCTAVFTDVSSLLEHLWICDLRSKFMDRNSEQFVCLECGKFYKGEKCTYNHVQKHHQVLFLIAFTRDVTKFEFRFNSVQTLNIFSRFEIVKLIYLSMVRSELNVCAICACLQIMTGTDCLHCDLNDKCTLPKN